jgi:hypothetical protein
MERARHHWKRVPASVRKPLVLVVGSLFVIAAAATGWLPGPGGIPLFLIGVAILATEFAWAERFRDRIMAIIKHSAAQYKTHPLLATLLLIGCTVAAITGIYLFYAKM